MRYLYCASNSLLYVRDLIVPYEPRWAQSFLALKNHLCFRDALLVDPELAEAYGKLKWELVDRAGIDRETYTRAKTDFILEVLRQAGFTEAEIRVIESANR